LTASRPRGFAGAGRRGCANIGQAAAMFLGAPDTSAAVQFAAAAQRLLSWERMERRQNDSIRSRSLSAMRCGRASCLQLVTCPPASAVPRRKAPQAGASSAIPRRPCFLGADEQKTLSQRGKALSGPICKALLTCRWRSAREIVCCLSCARNRCSATSWGYQRRVCAQSGPPASIISERVYDSHG